MNINTFLTPEVVSLIITAVIIPTAIKGLNISLKYIESKTGNDKFNKYLELAENAIETSVLAVGQIYVDGLKKSGDFTQANKEEAFNQAKTRALSIMSDTTKEMLKDAYGDINSWIDNKIEYYVGKNK